MKNDVIYAIRTFLRTPAFTVVAVLTLALGIGATTAIFSVVNAVLLRPLPYAAADRLVVTRGSLPDLKDLEASATSFDGFAAWASNLYNLRTGTDTEQVLGGVVSRELMPLVGAQPVLGRTFTKEDDRQDTVVLGYGLWQSRFGGDPSVLGRTIDLSGTSYTVIGVAPSWFRFPDSRFQLWTPIGLMESQAPQQAQSRSLRIFTAVARLKENVALAQAQAETAALSERLAKTYPATNQNVAMTVESLYDRLVGDVKPALTILLGTVGLLLLIACANVANLMLARTTVREREIAIRVALGAGRARLLRQLVTESLTLAVAGGALGLIVTMWGVDLLPAALGARLPRADGIRVDGLVLAFSLLVTLLTGLFFGLAPAFHAAVRPSESLKETGRSVTGNVRARRLRRAIIIGETALAVIVLVGAGLLVRSFLSLTSRDPGFARANLISFNVQFVKLPDEPARAQAAKLLMERLSQVPGVEAAGAATGFPPVTPQRGTRFGIDGKTLGPDQDGAYFIAATPDYFTTLGTPVLRGRAIDATDTASAAPIVVVNRTLADQLFPHEDPVGRRLKLVNPEQSGDWRTIVGVVGDVIYRGLGEDPQPTVYTPFAQTPFMWLYVMVRTPSSPGPVMQSMRTLVPTIHPSLTAGSLRLMSDVVAESVAEPRFNMMLVSSFAMLALVLSAIGIYGVIAYSVAQRTHEIGVRMALGAEAGDVMKLVIGEGIGVAAAGVALGLAGAALLTKFMSSMLVGVTARDPLTFAGGALVLLSVAVLASYVPARRATRVEPVAALRAE